MSKATASNTDQGGYMKEPEAEYNMGNYNTAMLKPSAAKVIKNSLRDKNMKRQDKRRGSSHNPY